MGGTQSEMSASYLVVITHFNSLGSLVHHQAKRVGQVTAGSIRVPGGIDDVDLSLNLRVAISGLADDHPWQTSRLPDVADLPDKVDHVWTGFPPCSCTLLQVKVDSITAVLLRPGGHTDCHFPSCLLGGE